MNRSPAEACLPVTRRTKSDASGFVGWENAAAGVAQTRERECPVEEDGRGTRTTNTNLKGKPEPLRENISNYISLAGFKYLYR